LTEYNVKKYFTEVKSEEECRQKQDSPGEGLAYGLSEISWQRKWFKTIETLKRGCR